MAMIGPAETIIPGLTLYRDALGPESIPELVADSEQLHRYLDDLRGLNHKNPIDLSVCLSRNLGQLRGVIGPQLTGVLEDLCIPDFALVSTNFYRAKSHTAFHQDNFDKSIVIHPIGGGVLDYAPEAEDREGAEGMHQTLEIEAGDIVINALPKLWHRGRNTGTIDRINVVVFERNRNK